MSWLDTHRVMAWGMLAAVVAICAMIALQPLIDAALTRRGLEQNRAAEMESGFLEAGAARFDPADVFLASDEAGAVLVLQGWLEADSQAAGLNLGILRVVGQSALGEHEAAWVEMVGGGDVQSVVELLEALERRRPALLLREFDLTGSPDDEPDRALDVRLVAGVLFNATGGAAP